MFSEMVFAAEQNLGFELFSDVGFTFCLTFHSGEIGIVCLSSLEGIGEHAAYSP